MTEKVYREAASYLWVSQSAEVWVQIELDSFRCSRQSDATDQQDKQHNERKRCCDVNNLAKEQKTEYYQNILSAIKTSGRTLKTLLILTPFSLTPPP